MTKPAPTAEQWIAAVHEICAPQGLDASLALAGDRTYTGVRAQAWALLLQQNPDYSFTGLARASGFDHTSVLYALGRVKGKLNRSRFTPRMKTVYRRPHIRADLSKIFVKASAIPKHLRAYPRQAGG